MLHDVTKIYPNGKTALEDVDLVIPEGDFVFLVGPSGAGKSTLIKLLIRDEVATHGAVDPRRPGPRPAAAAAASRRSAARSGSCSRTSSCLPAKSVWENVAFALEVTGTPRRRIRPAVDRVLALVGLTAQRASCPASCPAASSSEPRSPGPSSTTLASSSPTSRPATSIPLISWEIIQLLLRINELGVTVLMATHNADVVTALRKRVVALEEGRVIRDEVGGIYHRVD